SANLNRASVETMPPCKLTYFDIRGLGEVARQLLHLSGTPFEDDRVPAHDGYGTWMKMKNTTPFGTLPLLSVVGKRIPTSGAINHYLAKQFGFAGQSAYDEALVMALADQWMDYFDEAKPWLLTENGLWPGEVDEKMKEKLEAGIAKHFPLMENFIKEHGSGGHCVGSSLTWIDLLLTDHFRSLLRHFPDALTPYPLLSGVKKMAASHTKLSEWRKEHDEPF
ncbi:hypothetical protein PMAYCL1PPCAC_15865, partial [Pristionchus mayeri]